MGDLEDSTYSLEEAREPFRPDLTPQDFQELDWDRINEYGKALDNRKLFCGQATEPLDPAIVNPSTGWFARGNWSCIFSADICGQWFACKRIWTTCEYDRKFYVKEIENLQILRNAPHWHVIQLLGFDSMPGRSYEGNLILSPLAECTLEDYLSQEPLTGRRQVVQHWFGCLAGGL